MSGVWSYFVAAKGRIWDEKSRKKTNCKRLIFLLQIFAQDQSISNIKDSLSVVKGEFSVCFSVEKFTS